MMTFASAPPCVRASKPINPPLTIAAMAIPSAVLCRGELRHACAYSGFVMGQKAFTV
jgi:hypothetical protein